MLYLYIEMYTIYVIYLKIINTNSIDYQDKLKI